MICQRLGTAAELSDAARVRLILGQEEVIMRLEYGCYLLFIRLELGVKFSNGDRSFCPLYNSVRFEENLKEDLAIWLGYLFRVYVGNGRMYFQGGYVIKGRSMSV